MELGARKLFKLSQDLHRTLSQGPTPSGGYRGGGGGGGGQTRPMPPLTNKDTPPVHCNEFHYM